MNKRWILGLLGYSVFFCVRILWAESQPIPNLKNYQALVSQWVSLKKIIHEEQQRWEEQQHYFENEKELLLQEKKMLINRIQESKKNRADYANEILRIQKSIQQNQQSQEKLLPILSEAEQKIVDFQSTIPTIFLKELDLLKIDENIHKKIKDRLRSIYQSYEILSQFYQSIHLTQEILVPPGGSEQVFDVIYLGMSSVYAVSQDGQWAAFSHFQNQSLGPWIWDSSIVKDVQKVVQMTQNNQTPSLVMLPILAKNNIDL